MEQPLFWLFLFFPISCLGSKETGSWKTFKSHWAAGDWDGTKEQDLHSVGGQWQWWRCVQRRKEGEEEPRKGGRKEKEAPQAKKRWKSLVKWGRWKKEVGSCILDFLMEKVLLDENVLQMNKRIWVLTQFLYTIKLQWSNSDRRTLTHKVEMHVAFIMCTCRHTAATRATLFTYLCIFSLTFYMGHPLSHESPNVPVHLDSKSEFKDQQC